MKKVYSISRRQLKNLTRTKINQLVLDQEARIIELEGHLSTDYLTGAMSLKAIKENIEHLLNRAKFHKSPISILVIDVDKFKNVNDSYGHHAGDYVLREIVRSVKIHLRMNDNIGRIGGDEFLAVLQTGPFEALAVAERIRMSVEDQHIETNGHPVTITVGIASAPNFSYDLENLKNEADVAMYKMKASGRNRCVVATPLKEK